MDGMIGEMSGESRSASLTVCIGEKHLEGNVRVSSKSTSSTDQARFTHIIRHLDRSGNAVAHREKLAEGRLSGCLLPRTQEA
jgi:hypothetical protein